MISIRYPVLILFVITLIGAGYLGFALIHLPHDKLIHFTTFCILTIEFYFIFDTHYRSLKVLRGVTLVVCTFGGSVSLEIIQHTVNPSRVFDVYDILANILGSLLGLGISVGFMAWRKNTARQERIRYRQLNTQIIGQDEDEDEDTEGDTTMETELPNHADTSLSASEDYVNIQLQDVKSPSGNPLHP
ncbi:Uncharacterized protein C11E3.10 [Candida viswanathii]|uniref:Uncharacterized protein C11E3.10 n=1 Tax=Candida viswanathii TaxID=5486 RepID=A0A367YDN5_9ASCO|nr:Uncharacterized protein C11E3.10 [Candida viswanathii]